MDRSMSLILIGILKTKRKVIELAKVVPKTLAMPHKKFSANKRSYHLKTKLILLKIIKEQS